MTVRELLLELSLFPLDALVIVRSEEDGFTDATAVSIVQVVTVLPPIAYISHRLAGAAVPPTAVTAAVLVAAPEAL